MYCTCLCPVLPMSSFNSATYCQLSHVPVTEDHLQQCIVDERVLLSQSLSLNATVEDDVAQAVKRTDGESTATRSVLDLGHPEGNKCSVGQVSPYRLVTASEWQQ